MNQQYMRNSFDAVNEILILTTPIGLWHLTVAWNLCTSVRAMMNIIRVSQLYKSIEKVCAWHFYLFSNQIFNFFLVIEDQDICYETVSSINDMEATSMRFQQCGHLCKTNTVTMAVHMPTQLGESRKAPLFEEELQRVRGCWQNKIQSPTVMSPLASYPTLCGQLCTHRNNS